MNGCLPIFTTLFAWIGMITFTFGILLALGIIGFHQEIATAGE